MFPIKDHNPSGRTPYVTYALITLNIVIFLSYVSLMGDREAILAFYSKWALVPGWVNDGVGLYTFVTSMFLHGGWMHLGGNMLFLYIFGDNIEDEMGHLPFLIFYLACGIAAGVIHVISAPYSMVPTVGASGAIAAVMGGYLLLFPKARVDILLILIVFFKIFSVRAWLMLLVWIGFQVFGSVTSGPDQGGVAYWAHTGGFVVGLLLTIPLWRRRGGRDFWRRTDGHPPHEEARYRFAQSRIPRVPRR